MEKENQDSNRIKKYLLWGLPFLLILSVALFLLFFYLSRQGWATYRPSNVRGDQMAFTFDSSGDAWIGSANGLAIYNGEDWTKPGLGSSIIQSMATDLSGNIWIGTSGRARVFNGEEWTTYNLPFYKMYSMAIDAAGNVWVGDQYYGVGVFDGENWITYTEADSGLVADHIHAIAVDLSGYVWLGTYEGVSVFDGEDWTTYTENNSGLVDDHINDIAVDPSGNIWFGTRYGVGVFDGEHWTTYTEDNSGLIDDIINSIAIDSSGNAWFGTNQGVSFFDGKSWMTFTRSNSGLGINHVNTIAVDPSGDVWFGFYNGINLYNPKEAFSTSAFIHNLHDYFFSPLSIGLTSISLLILWLSIADNNKPALVGPAGWAVSLFFFGPQIFENPGIGIFAVSNIGSLGALLAGRIKKDDGNRKSRLLKGMVIGIVIPIILGALLYLFNLWFYSF